jgi:hypothetical protein
MCVAIVKRRALRTNQSDHSSTPITENIPTAISLAPDDDNDLAHSHVHVHVMDRIPSDQLYATVEGVHQQKDMKLS